MKQNSLVMVVVCIIFLTFVGEAFGHHNPNHKVYILDHWIDGWTTGGWFCNTEIPLLHSMRVAEKNGLAAAESFLERYQNFLDVQGKPICDKESTYQLKPVRILAQNFLPNKGTTTIIEVKVTGGPQLYTMVGMPVLKPEEDPDTLIVGLPTILPKYRVCDTKEQVAYIMDGYRNSKYEGETRYYMYNKSTNAYGESVCGTLSGLANITDKYETIEISTFENLSKHPTVFRLEIKKRSFYSWTYGAITELEKPKMPEIEL